MKLLWIRHGLTKGNEEKRYIGTTEEALSEAGRRQLRDLRFELPDRLFVSPRIRCLETAEILFPGKDYQIVEDFAECDFGEFEQKNYQELSAHPVFLKWMETGELNCFPGGEGVKAFQNRCCKAFYNRMLTEKPTEESFYAFVVHGGTIMSILERFALPKRNYFDWQIKNGEAILTELNFNSLKEQKRALQVFASGKPLC